MDRNIPEPIPRITRAALREMRFWNPLCAEHIGLIKDGFEPDAKDRTEKAQGLISMFQGLAAILQSEKPVAPPDASDLIHNSAGTVEAALDFFLSVQEGMSGGWFKTALPDNAIAHIIKETLYYQDKLHAADRDSRLPESASAGSGTAPQVWTRSKLIAAPPETLSGQALAEILFWVEISAEHGDFLAEKSGPVLQERFTREILSFVNDFDGLHARLEQGRGHPGALADLLRCTAVLNQHWLNFLEALNESAIGERIPAGRGVLRPGPAIHIRHEQAYFQAIVVKFIDRLDRRNI
ncbi:MAG: DUF2935 domain-containing protein [Bacillota bacterium]